MNMQDYQIFCSRQVKGEKWIMKFLRLQLGLSYLGSFKAAQAQKKVKTHLSK